MLHLKAKRFRRRRPVGFARPRSIRSERSIAAFLDEASRPDIASRARQVRYSPQSGHSSARFAGPLCASHRHRFHPQAGRADDIRRALDDARAHLKRCEEELDRFEPSGCDYRNVQDRLVDDVVRAENDVHLLERALCAAEHAADAFEAC